MAQAIRTPVIFARARAACWRAKENG